MKHIKILFDASSLLESINAKEGSRSGIFWVTYNILQQFKYNPIYHVTIFLQTKIVFDKNNEIGRFLSGFPRYYLDNEQKYNINIEVHLNQIKYTKNIFIIAIRLLKILKNILLILWSYLCYSLFQKVDNFDVFFSPVFTQPEKIRNISSIKIFHVLYDCIPVLDDVSYPLMDIDHWFVRLQQNLNKDTYYFCISENTKKDFLNVAPSQLDADKMLVTHIAPSQTFSTNYDKIELKRVLEKYAVIQNHGDCYIFSFCNIDPRKNILFTVKCFLKFIERNNVNNMFFYLGGGYFKPYIEQFVQEISSFPNHDKVVMFGYVDDEDVNILYSNSLFFTYLSQYEGFGLPPLEAMQAGTPVISSNSSSLPEVVGDAAISITYNDEIACIKAFEDLYFNESLREYYIAKGLERAKLFSWEKTFDVISKKIIDVVENQSRESKKTKERNIEQLNDFIDKKNEIFCEDDNINYCSISEIIISKDKNILKQKVDDIIYVDIKKGNIVLRCGICDPQFYLPLQKAIEKPVGNQCIEMFYSNDRAGKIQIFYDYGNGLSEKNSFSCIINSKVREKKIHFPIVGWHERMMLAGIRIDPPNGTKFTLIHAKILTSLV